MGLLIILVVAGILALVLKAFGQEIQVILGVVACYYLGKFGLIIIDWGTSLKETGDQMFYGFLWVVGAIITAVGYGMCVILIFTILAGIWDLFNRN
jgi:hypothetical protein